ncbi:MAG TPA: phosphoribosylaminoimidazolesuccinocarboxamide synthase [Candidatus Omnitrophota bacterium]|nr:phosphoribosylaminoimidazolesuccinocarboxamide synthase [Candidatus Omnitrophota bacterium]HPD84357.1 phosphoribosylaminoimidazolesuccinocarboxamide synthase [Candidatus Omnitrophota bacterium]HRZ03215.1 phosphoribosylaminoimidazolesuccinocarboxamide synthase [Candidatus Omnitrophota bacterium]
MEKGKKIYEGKAKILYETDSPDYLIQYFKDDATAFNAAKKGTINQKGVVNNKISTKIFEFLETKGIPTHFEKMLNDRDMLVKKVTIFPLEVIIRNVAAGSLSKILNIPEGTKLACPVLEFCYKADSLNDPMINEYHIRALGLATEEELETVKKYTFQINELMKKFFAAIGVDLIDFKIEFGKFKGKIILADEISPDTCRLWEKETGRKLDKDRFRRDLGGIEEAYQEILSRVTK